MFQFSFFQEIYVLLFYFIFFVNPQIQEERSLFENTLKENKIIKNYCIIELKNKKKSEIFGVCWEILEGRAGFWNNTPQLDIKALQIYLHFIVQFSSLMDLGAFLFYRS